MTRKPTPKAVTPLMAQYLTIRGEVNPSAVFLYRMGDFYEAFFEDAERMAETLEVALTRRGKHLGKPIPMAGIPVHSAEVYIHQMSRAGLSVAICEEIESPSETRKSGPRAVTKRAVVRIIPAEGEAPTDQSDEGRAA